MSVSNSRIHIDRLRQLILLSFFGELMFISKMLMDGLPNIHMIAMLIGVITLVYRSKALVSIYVFAILVGALYGFDVWWVPYLYIWIPLWAVFMLIPKRTKPALAIPVYIAVCFLHGLLYGVMYAPVQALAYRFSFEMTLTWVLAGLPWDIVHAVGNAVMATMIYPLYVVLNKLESKIKIQ